MIKRLIGVWTNGTYGVHTLATQVFVKSSGGKKFLNDILKKSCKHVGKQEEFFL